MSDAILIEWQNSRHFENGLGGRPIEESPRNRIKKLLADGYYIAAYFSGDQNSVLLIKPL